MTDEIDLDGFEIIEAVSGTRWLAKPHGPEAEGVITVQPAYELAHRQYFPTQHGLASMSMPNTFLLMDFESQPPMRIRWAMRRPLEVEDRVLLKKIMKESLAKTRAARSGLSLV